MLRNSGGSGPFQRRLSRRKTKLKPIDFLEEVWGLNCREGDWVFLSAKGPGGWSDRAFRYSREISGELAKWLDGHPSTDYNLYFCPLPFNGSKRRKENVVASRLLYSDLDTATKYPVKPSILWESSPGRFQAIWILDKRFEANELEKLNKGMTYAITNADRGGWDLTQVLRIPGTHNLKYRDRPLVRVRDHSVQRRYSQDDIPVRDERHTSSSATAETICEKYSVKSRLIRTLFKDRPTVGKRSEMLWKLENDLIEIGMTDDEVVTVIRASVWNKFKGRTDEDKRIRSEVEKIRRRKGIEPMEPEKQEKKEEKEPRQSLQIETYSQLMSGQRSTAGWSVKDFWMKNSHGIVAGEPKSFKSTLVMDMAFAVASGTPFLGMETPRNNGPVIYVNNENPSWIFRDRLEKMAAARGVTGKVTFGRDNLRVTFPPVLPMHFVNQQNFSFDDEKNKGEIVAMVRDIKPRLLIFDPLYLMFSGDVNSANDLMPHLSWLLDLKTQFPMSLILIHHWNKNGNSTRGGQRMLGSTTLHGWIDSAWYLESRQGNDEGKATITMEREFRGAGMPPKLDISLAMGGMGELGYSITTAESTATSIEDEIMIVLDNSEAPLSVAAIQRRTGRPMNTVKKTLESMVSAKTVRNENGKFSKIGGSDGNGKK